MLCKNWLDLLHNDPLPALLEWEDKALNYFLRRDLLEEPLPLVERLWELPEAIRLVKKQRPDGSWKYPGRSSGSIPGQNYAQAPVLLAQVSISILVEQLIDRAGHSIPVGL